jgi:TRAP-type mannitol/chloroaromatic compound transport system substrate-binding protein
MKEERMERRKFIVKAGGVLVAAGAAAVVEAPHVIAQQRFQWRMATSWTPALDVLQGNAQRFAKIVDEVSGGRLRIQVFAAGELIPALGVFDACSQGTIESYHSASYYYAGKEPGFQWFTTVPFGMNAQSQVAWHQHGDGLKLWEEAYKPFNLVPRPGGSTGVQMAGWFRKKINTIADFKGLKMRIPGLGGKTLAKAGTTVVLMPGGEIYTSLERGVIDAAEWVAPHDDLKLGLHRTARYYYTPGWHEPGAVTEYVFSTKAYDSLPGDLQRTLDYAAASIQTLMLAEYDWKNSLALEKLSTEFKGKAEVLPLPAPVMKELKKLAAEVMKEESEKSATAKKVYESYTKFQSSIQDYAGLSEGTYHRLILG